jgi:hypothetical protein
MKHQLTATTSGVLKVANPAQSQYSGDRSKIQIELLLVRG